MFSGFLRNHEREGGKRVKERREEEVGEQEGEGKAEAGSESWSANFPVGL